MTIKSRLLMTQRPSNTFSLLTLMQFQALNWLNITQMNLFSSNQITVAVVVDIRWMGITENYGHSNVL